MRSRTGPDWSRGLLLLRRRWRWWWWWCLRQNANELGVHVGQPPSEYDCRDTRKLAAAAIERQRTVAENAPVLALQADVEGRLEALDRGLLAEHHARAEAQNLSHSRLDGGR
jgi:hypothetical protein